MRTLRIGVAPYEDMKARTMAIARGELTPGPDIPDDRLPKEIALPPYVRKYDRKRRKVW